MKKNILRIIIIIFIIIWMCLVFNFSGDNGETSSGLSRSIAKFFSSDEDVINIIEPIIRKLAHLSEYALGGFLFYGLFLTYKISPKKQVIFAGLVGIIYATTDEIHQLFIPGRSGRIQDVGIDSLGVFLGICALLFIVKIVQIIKNKKIREEDSDVKF